MISPKRQPHLLGWKIHHWNLIKSAILQFHPILPQSENGKAPHIMISHYWRGVDLRPRLLRRKEGSNRSNRNRNIRQLRQEYWNLQSLLLLNVISKVDNVHVVIKNLVRRRNHRILLQFWNHVSKKFINPDLIFLDFWSSLINNLNLSYANIDKWDEIADLIFLNKLI